MSTPESNRPAGDARTLATSHLIAAPPERVFAAIADPQQLARWWGPNGFTNTIHAFDFRPGGKWRVTMHGPDGVDYPNQTVRFATIEPAQRVVMVHESTPWFELSLRLTPEDGGTRLDWRQTFGDAATCAMLAPMCVPANEQNLDRLQAVVADA